MRDDSAQLSRADQKTVPHVTLSRWINEPYPPLTELLSAHDVARLTRRPRWLLVGLELIGRFFPERRGFEEELSAGGGRMCSSGWRELSRTSAIRRARPNRVCEDSLDSPAYRWNPVDVAPVSGRILRGVSVSRTCHDDGSLREIEDRRTRAGSSFRLDRGRGALRLGDASAVRFRACSAPRIVHSPHDWRAHESIVRCSSRAISRSSFVRFLTVRVVGACLRASYLADDRSLDIAFNDDLESEATARIWELSTLD
jgi:hypothetical protein